MDLKTATKIPGKHHQSALFRLDGKWHYAPQLVGEPTQTLVDLVWQMRTDGMGFYSLVPELENFGLTIQDLYKEDPTGTMRRLREAVEREVEQRKYIEQNGVKVNAQKRRAPILKLVDSLKDAPDELWTILEEALALYSGEEQVS